MRCRAASDQSAGFRAGSSAPVDPEQTASVPEVVSGSGATITGLLLSLVIITIILRPFVRRLVEK